MDQMKLQRIIISMKENNVPQLIVADPASICYLTGRMLNCGERMLALYLDVEGNHKFFIGKLFPQSTPIEGAEIVYFDDTDDYVGMLADVMRENTVVGIDKVWPAKFLLSLMNKLNATKFIDGSFIIDNIRQIKDEKEQELMRIASKINDTAMEKLMPLVKEGYTELEMADKLFEMYAEMDAPEFSFDPALLATIVLLIRVLVLADKIDRGEPWVPSDAEPEGDWLNDSTRPIIHAIAPQGGSRARPADRGGDRRTRRRAAPGPDVSAGPGESHLSSPRRCTEVSTSTSWSEPSATAADRRSPATSLHDSG